MAENTYSAVATTVLLKEGGGGASQETHSVHSGKKENHRNFFTDIPLVVWCGCALNYVKQVTNCIDATLSSFVRDPHVGSRRRRASTVQ